MDELRVLFVYKGVEWLGIQYISAVLKAAGHKTDLAFDAGLGGSFYFKEKKNKDYSFILGKIKQFKPDIIMFGCVTNLFPWVKETARVVKQRYPDIPLLVGGIHPTAMPEQVLSNPDIDMICLGEGEEAILELVDSLEKKDGRTDIRNIWFKKKGKIIRNPLRPLKENLDELPFPDKEIFAQHGVITDRFHVMTSRGCPYQCTYCFNHYYQRIYSGTCSKYYRRRSIESVIGEIKHYMKNYRVKSIHFYDDIFILDEKYVVDFCKRYKEEIGLPFYCLVRANLVNENIIKSLKDAGCEFISMGIESGNDIVRKNILKRDMTNEQIITAANLIKKYNIKLITFNIFGFPDETPEQMLDTVNLNLKIKPHGIFTYTFYPFPGTDLLEISKERGYITDEVYRKIVSGEDSYIGYTILKHPYAVQAWNMKLILPILNKLPGFVQKKFLKSWVNNKHTKLTYGLLSVANIPFIWREEAVERLKEQFSVAMVGIKKKLDGD